MQIGQFLGALVALVATLALLGWWSGRVVMRAAGRLLGRAWWLYAERQFQARITILWAVAVVVAAVLVFAAWRAVRWLAPAGGDGSWTGLAAQLALWLVTLGALLVAAAALASVTSTAAAVAATMRRRRTLAGLELSGLEPFRSGPAGPQALAGAVPGAAAGAVTGRRIVICCDGTGNRPDDQEAGLPATTNVWKLYRALVCDETQTAWYDAGVGSDTSSTAMEVTWSRRLLEAVGARMGGQLLAAISRLARVVEAATGTGITENIAQAYTEIVRQHRPGDRIYLIGFSRGAYTARCVAGVISRCGLLRPEYIRYAEDVVHLYRTRQNPDDRVAVPTALTHGPAPTEVEFLGLFDTVGSLGVPLWGWWFRALPLPEWRNKALSTNPMAICRHVYHAMAMDERRSQFFPTPFGAPVANGATRLEQVWFRGAHADIGGGYAETGLSDITLDWMAERAHRHGLCFREDAFAALRPDPLARLHDELTRSPSWRLFGSWPRWHPVPEAATPGGTPAPPGELHPSVLQRRDVLQDRLGRPDFRCLRVGEAVEIAAEAPREWDRTGIVLEAGCYRLTYLGGLWRDAEERYCGPAGQQPDDIGFPRSRFGFRRRLPEEAWMRLCLTVAHPREWPLRELGLRSLLRFLYWRDPEALRRQVAPVGVDLQRPGDAVWLRNDAAAGLLHVFANDLWFTAGNNAGAIRLRLERLDHPADSGPCWILGAGGEWAREPPLAPAPP
jgi:uncharacterized protein (DUF2235 family)